MLLVMFVYIVNLVYVVISFSIYPKKEEKQSKTIT